MALIFTPLDIGALTVFVTAWVGYTFYADKISRSGKNLMTVMHAYRLRWMTRMLERDQRMPDVQILSTQMRSVSLFASTTIFILGALVALSGAVDEARAVLANVPYAVVAPPGLWEVKILLLLLIFTYAFFKFAWALRQFNYSLSLVGAAPMPEQTANDPALKHGVAERISRITTLAVSSFNRGVRAYYFALATLSWFVHPAVFALSSAFVVWVLYRREFRSFTLKTLTDPKGDPAL